ncbi:MAG: hypothetical protein WBL44_15940, partial [Nitrososphaeraceae archaeon]
LHIIHRIQKEARTVLQNHTFQSKYEQLSYQEYVRELFLIGLASKESSYSEYLKGLMRIHFMNS